MDNQPTKRPPSQILLMIGILAVLVIAGYGVYAYVVKNGNGNTNNANNSQVANTNASINTNSTVNTNLVANSNVGTNAATNTNIDMSGWKTFENDKYGYTIKYPVGATIAEASKSFFSLSQEDVAKGLTFDDVYNQYTGKICITINYKDTGYINISAPENDQFAHVICGRTGVGVTKSTIERNVPIQIDGEQYTLTGHEFIATPQSNENPEVLNLHQETLDVILNDKTKIEMGSWSSDEFTFQDYQNIRDILIEIISSYHKI